MAKDPKRQKAEKYKTWLTPKRAVEALVPIYEPTFAKSDIFERLRAGLLVAYAQRVYSRDDPEGTSHVEVDTGTWIDADPLDLVKSHFWETGNFRVELDGIGLASFAGTALDPKGIQAILDAHGVKETPPLPPSESAKHAGGRPNKDFWDDLLIEMFRRIHFAEFSPKRQADIMNAMLDWAAERGLELGETAAKARARKLFDALQEKVGN